MRRVLLILVAAMCAARPAVGQNHVAHVATLAPPPIAVRIAEWKVQQQCCVENQSSGGSVKELAGPIDIIYAAGAL